MEEEIKEELKKIVIKYLEAENEDLESAVTLATDFSKNNSLPPDSLLELSNSCGSSELYSLAYIFARTCSILSIENTKKATAHRYAGFASVLMGRYGEAEEEYKLAIEADPKHIGAHSNYGVLLQEMERYGEAEKEYKLALKTDSKHADTHYNYGNLLQEMERFEEAEEEYKLAIKANPKHVDAHSNYGLLLIQMKRLEDAEKEFKLAIETNFKNASTHSSYGGLLQEMGRYGEAENEYKLAIEADPNYSFTHNNYGNLLQEMGRYEEAENEYKLAIEANFKDATRHYNYGRLLQKTGRNEEAENECKLAIELDPKNPYYHTSYSLILASLNLEKQAIEEVKAASRRFKENGDITKEHLSIAWLYEDLANKYYDLKKYQNSGDYAEISGNEYIEASKYTKDLTKDTLLTKGYTLKARAKIRKLEIKPSFYERKVKRYIQPKDYEIKTLIRIMDCIMDASKNYEKAAEISPGTSEICSACSTSMSCLSDMLDYMLVVIKKEKEVPELENEIENWKTKFIVCREIYKGNKKGEAFIQSLEELQACIKNLETYKKSKMRRDERAFEECIKKLLVAARDMEGPLQKIIEDSAKKMDIYRRKNMLYTYNQVYTEQNRLFRTLNWIFGMLKNYVKPITISVIGGLILVLAKQVLGLP